MQGATQNAFASTTLKASLLYATQNECLAERTIPFIQFVVTSKGWDCNRHGTKTSKKRLKFLMMYTNIQANGSDIFKPTIPWFE